MRLPLLLAAAFLVSCVTTRVPNNSKGRACQRECQAVFHQCLAGSNLPWVLLWPLAVCSSAENNCLETCDGATAIQPKDTSSAADRWSEGRTRGDEADETPARASRTQPQRCYNVCAANALGEVRPVEICCDRAWSEMECRHEQAMKIVDCPTPDAGVADGGITAPTP